MPMALIYAIFAVDYFSYGAVRMIFLFFRYYFAFFGEAIMQSFFIRISTLIP
jgi:hypothetical protein